MATLDTELPKNEEARAAIFEALGAASACWENLEDAGPFLSEDALGIGLGLILRLNLMGYAI